MLYKYIKITYIKEITKQAYTNLRFKHSICIKKNKKKKLKNTNEYNENI